MSSWNRMGWVVASLLLLSGAVWLLRERRVIAQSAPVDTVIDDAGRMISDGRQIFRFDTFGDESFWGDKLKLHQAIQGSKFGGVGDGLSPRAALNLGLKVDADAVPSSLASQIKSGQLDLTDPANTLALLKLKAVVGVTGFFDRNGQLSSIGLQCAFCHSTVDDSFCPALASGSMGGRIET